MDAILIPLRSQQSYAEDFTRLQNKQDLRKFFSKSLFVDTVLSVKGEGKPEECSSTSQAIANSSE